MTDGFRYQRLLNVKDILLQQQAVALRELRENRDVQQQVLGGIHDIKTEHLAAGYGVEIIRGDIVNPIHLQTHVWYTQQLNDHLQRQIHKVNKSAAKVEEQRQAVEQATVEKKSLERLREKQLERDRVNAAREEQKKFDDIASRRFIMAARVES